LNVVQRHVFREVAPGRFEETSRGTERVPALPTNMDGLLLEESGDKLNVCFKWDWQVHGMPPRPRHVVSGLVKPRVLVLAAGETLQLRVNGRHNGSDEQWYTQYTFNVAYGPRLAENVFIGGPFTQSVSMEEHLF
jgi:hypothetical protein